MIIPETATGLFVILKSLKYELGDIWAKLGLKATSSRSTAG